MATTREQLQKITGNLDESLGLRHSMVRSLRVPQAEARDLGRMPLRNAGRIPTDHIIPDPNQPRKEFDDELLKQFGQSLDSTGQINPIRVRWAADHQKWLLVCDYSRPRTWKERRVVNRETAKALSGCPYQRESLVSTKWHGNAIWGVSELNDESSL